MSPLKRKKLSKIRLKLDKLVVNTISYLIEQDRISLLPLIIKEIVVIDDLEKGFIKGTIEGSDDQPSEELISKVKEFIKDKIGVTPNLEYMNLTNENIFKYEFGNYSSAINACNESIKKTGSLYLDVPIYSEDWKLD